MAETIDIAIVDDHPLYRAGVRQALRKVAGVKVVSEGASAADACRIARDVAPDIILLDISMPGDGIEAVRSICAAATTVKIIMLTGSDDDERVSAALSAGASGYVLKGANTSELIEALRTVHAGSPYVTPSLSSRLVLSSARKPKAPATKSAVSSGLSVREQAILDCLVQGMTNSEIASELGLALPTVKNYLSRILEKLKVRNRAEAIAVCLKSK